MASWRELYDELEILGQRRRKRIATERTIKRFEKEAGISLPAGFREFAQVFGAGELCGYYRFCVPLGRKDYCDLATFNAVQQVSVEDGVWEEYASLDVLRLLLFFGSTIGGELFAWSTDEVTDADANDYAIYRFSDRPPRRRVAKLFAEFFERCRRSKLDKFDEPPEQTYLKY